MTKTPETTAAAPEKRKINMWSRDKISQLIQLYRHHECLWNHYTEGYKCKDRRNKAISAICATLHISKFDFGKKIHNLRNQFNSEMKKLERRMEEAGSTAAELTPGQRCRWEHFESLMFLQNVIEPRPGSYPLNFQPPKKMRMKIDYVSEDDAEITREASANVHTNTPVATNNIITTEDTSVTEYNFDDNTAEDTDENGVTTEDDFQTYENDHMITPDREENYDLKYQPAANITKDVPSATVVTATLVPQTPVIKNVLAKVSNTQPQPQQQKQCQQEIIQFEEVQHLQATTPTSNNTSISHLNSLMPQRSANRSLEYLVTRDQWDAFGELIANEFRNLNSEVSRKKLKRKIMHAMLEVGEEDDNLLNIRNNDQ